MDTTTCVSDL